MIINKFIDELSKAHLPPEAIGKIIGLGKRIEVKNQARLIEPQQICDKAYFVLKGGFVCRYCDEELEIERTINFFLDDFQPFMSCVDSFFSGSKTRCELRAICHSEVIAFEKKDIETHIHQDIHLFRFYHSLVTKALQGENDFKLKIISYSSERLYDYLITHCPRIIQRVPSRFVAEFMGISPEWLSKLKHRI
ncbi:Crp/Fnr family transcriptional regulator [Larkinella rosea]|uniref:Crp/Fnr family transcriptional regulator n=1 Tax=Larkinella rosea TaxID=2025312 RepID=A0A3P1BDC5_9BACT|nr:Crp/Fnr family transcriptional regulator [Larkinella rosea]RRA98782.1 Crp/Fnr family transcriptional regulator [Larkinella rosea]